MSKNKLSLEAIEKEVMDKANFLYICKYNGKEHLRSCIREAMQEITKLNEVQICKIFDVFNKDLDTIQSNFEEYVEVIYNKMKEKGAE